MACYTGIGCNQRMHVVDALKAEIRGSNKNMEKERECEPHYKIFSGARDTSCQNNFPKKPYIL